MIDWNIVFSSLTALGTIGAVIVALFQEPIKNWLKRPILKITFENNPRWKVETSVLNDLPLPAIWFRLKIENTGKSIAKKVEGKLIAIVHPDGNTSREDIDPMELHWVGNNSATVDLLPREWEYLDVFFVYKDIEDSRYESILREKGQNPNNDYLRRDRIHLYPLDRTPRNVTFDPQRDDYILNITVYCSNAKLIEKKYKLIDSKQDTITMREV